MNLKINSNKIIASAMALSLVTTGVIASETSTFSKIVPINTISAEAAYTSGDWEYELTESNTVKITKYNGTKTKVTIPLKINNKTVTELGYGLFKSNNTITEVIIQKNTQIKEIPASCFYNAVNLRSVTIPNGINRVSSSAFCGTSNLQSISLPTVNTIEYQAFYNSGLNSIQMPSVTKIGSSAFYNCKNLVSVNLPNTLTTLQYGAFTNCTSLKSIAIPESVTWFGGSIFNNCTNLKSITFSNVPEYFAGTNLDNCISLENVNVPNAEVFGQLLANHVLKGTNVSKVNGESIVTYKNQRYSPVSQPVIKDEYYQQIQNYFEVVDRDRLPFFEEYLQAEIKYVVKTNTTQNMTDGQKIKALHDWICNKVDYAYLNGEPDPSMKHHVDSSVFMNDRTVCDGYARGLTLLLREAGIETYFLSSGGHAWCMVKLGKHFYHLDVTENDGLKIPMKMHSDTSIKLTETEDDSHFKWNIVIPYHSRITYDIPATTPACPYFIGDVDGDGVQSALDAKLIQKYLLKMYKVVNGVIYIDNSTFGIDDVNVLDVNYDGIINMQDAIFLS